MEIQSRSDSQAQLIGRPSSHKLLPTPVTVSGVSVASTFWLVLNFICIAGLIIAAGFPNWAVVATPRSSIRVSSGEIGLYYFCYTPNGAPRECSLYYPSSPLRNDTGLSAVELEDIAFLFGSSIVYGVGTVLLIISLAIGVLAYCKPRIKEQSVFLCAFTIQLLACVCLIIALVIFPLMFQSSFAKQFCGIRAEYYYRGRCDVQWCTILAMVVSSLSLYLPAFALFSMNVSDGLRAYNCC